LRRRLTARGSHRAGLSGTVSQGDCQEHFIDQCGDNLGLLLGSLCGIGEMTDSVQSAFERKPVDIGMVCEGGLPETKSGVERE